MFRMRVASALLANRKVANITKALHRQVQVSLIGAVSNVGSNTALLLKNNERIKKLNLYDDDDSVTGFGLEISHVPGGPQVESFSGESQLHSSIESSNIIVLVSKDHRKPGVRNEQMLAVNAPLILKICKAMSEVNPHAFLALATNPLNSAVPLASALLYKYNAYNPFKVFGITHIDTARTKAFVAKSLKVSPRYIQVPVIGGHSEETVIPLFSNITPSMYSIDQCQADWLTRLVRKAGMEGTSQTRGTESETLAMAWSINEFVAELVKAVQGDLTEVNCFTVNPHFGTKYFSGPYTVSKQGIVEPCKDFSMSEFETSLLTRALPVLNEEVVAGESHARLVAS